MHAPQRMLQCGDFEERRLSNCTPECVAFLRRLLCTDPMQRPSVAEIVADPWLQVDMCVCIGGVHVSMKSGAQR